MIQLSNLVVGYDRPLMKPLSYNFENGKVYGTKCFYVDAQGQIVEDAYVEE